MGGIVLAMTLTATYISASSFIGGHGAAYKYGTGWVLLAMIPASCSLAFARYSRQVRNSCAPLQCGDAERYAVCPLPESSSGVAGEFEFAGCVRWCDDRAVYRRCAPAGNRGGIPYETGLLIFGISIALYTAFGGFRASVLNTPCKAGDADWHRCAAYWRGTCRRWFK